MTEKFAVPNVIFFSSCSDAPDVLIMHNGHFCANSIYYDVFTGGN